MHGIKDPLANGLELLLKLPKMSKNVLAVCTSVGVATLVSRFMLELTNDPSWSPRYAEDTVTTMHF